MEISKHSIGVGSLCIDVVDTTNVVQKTETLQTHTLVNDQTLQSGINQRRKAVRQLKKAKNSYNNMVDFSRGSIATQKLEHSRLIKFERVRRNGKRIAKRAQ